MKILFISPSFFSRNLRGGTEKYLFNLINKLKKQHKISLLIPNDNVISLKNVEVFTYFKNKIPIFGEIGKGLSVLLSFIRIMLFHKPDIISNFLPNPAMAFIFPIAKALGIKTLQNFRGYMKENKLGQTFIDLSVNLSYFFTDFITTNAGSVINQFRSTLLFGHSKFDSIRKFYIPNAIDAKFWAPKQGEGNYTYDLAFIGNIYDRSRIVLKGFPNLYYAIENLARENHCKLKVVVIGDYSLKEIKKIINNFDPSYFDFRGLIKEREKIKEHLVRSKIFVLSSLGEGMPNALMEAMCLGVPSIATDVGAVRELIQDGGNGFIVPPNNSILLGEKIWILLQDPALQEKFSGNGHQWLMDNFSWKKNVKLINLLYKQLYNS